VSLLDDAIWWHVYPLPGPPPPPPPAGTGGQDRPPRSGTGAKAATVSEDWTPGSTTRSNWGAQGFYSAPSSTPSPTGTTRSITSPSIPAWATRTISTVSWPNAARAA